MSEHQQTDAFHDVVDVVTLGINLLFLLIQGEGDAVHLLRPEELRSASSLTTPPFDQTSARRCQTRVAVTSPYQAEMVGRAGAGKLSPQ